MNRLRQVATSERRGPIVWWFVLLLATNLVLLVLAYKYSWRWTAFFGALLMAAWVAPLALMHARAAPRRAKRMPPQPGEGTFDEWAQYARTLGRLVMYYGDILDLSPEIRRKLKDAQADLRDTLRAHPLRDDLERVCERIRAEAVEPIKDWFARKHDPEIRALANAYEQAASVRMDEDFHLLTLQAAVENAAALMTRSCMPRMLERERLQCASHCSWLAVQAAAVHAGRVSPVDLAEMLVIEWSDFSEPWQPAQALRRALARLAQVHAEPESAAAVAAEAAGAPNGRGADESGTIVYRNGKRYRRVRFHRRSERRRRRHVPGTRTVGILLSFGQWIRYSLRAWMLYR